MSENMIPRIKITHPGPEITQRRPEITHTGPEITELLLDRVVKNNIATRPGLEITHPGPEITH